MGFIRVHMLGVRKADCGRALEIADRLGVSGGPELSVPAQWVSFARSGILRFVVLQYGALAVEMLIV